MSQNYSEAGWNQWLENQDWSDFENCNTVDEMVDIFTANTSGQTLGVYQ